MQRYRTLITNRIHVLPIVILMPHSACNCRCVMCDIWKGNKNQKQLTEQDIKGLLLSLKRLGTVQVVMSGGEALLHPAFFQLCRILKEQHIRITLLSTGLLITKNQQEILQSVDDLIVSLDGDEATHDMIRNIPGAYRKLEEGVRALKTEKSAFQVKARTVIHKLNFRNWCSIVQAAKDMGLDGISFLPADVSSTAFNRETTWEHQKQSEIALSERELPELASILEELIRIHRGDFTSGFISETPVKLWNIHTYYGALLGKGDFPYKKCNAPWVSAVIEPDGSVRPCFFHDVIGNIRDEALPAILNGKKGLDFRKNLDMDADLTCKRCVCSLNLPARVNPAIVN